MVEDLKKDNEKLKEVKEYIGKFCNNKCFIAGLIILVPFIFILVLKFIYAYIPGEEIGKPGDWISFAGGYLGVIGAVCIVWYQMKKEERDEIRGLLFYIKDILEDNKKNYTLEYSKSIRNRALSTTYSPNGIGVKLFLKNFELNRTERLLLYKHKYFDLIKLNDFIIKISNNYKLTIEEENIFKNLKYFIDKEIENTKQENDYLLITNIKKVLELTIFLSLCFSRKEYLYSESVNIKTKRINFELIFKRINFKLFRKEIDLENKNLKLSEENFKNCLKQILEIKENDYTIIKRKYIILLTILKHLIFLYNQEYMIVLASFVSKKTNLFNDDYEKLISEISEEYEKLEKILR